MRFRAALLMAFVPLLQACSDTDAVTGIRDVAAPPLSGVIWDGEHNEGNPHFFWLPPMVSQPPASKLGTFEPDLSLTLQLVCLETSDSSLPCDPNVPLAEFTIGAGLLVESDHYKVDLDTKALNLAVSTTNVITTYRIQALTPRFPGFERGLLGFADIQLAETGKEAKNLSTNDLIGLVDGRTLPVKFRVDRGAIEIALKQATAGLGDAAVCKINCSITVIRNDETTKASLSDENGVEQTAMLFEPGDVNNNSVLLIDERTDDDGKSSSTSDCAPGVKGKKKQCFRYLITPDESFNNPVRFGICPFEVPRGHGLWRILKADDGNVTRGPELDVKDFLDCPGEVSALGHGRLGRFAAALARQLVRPLYAEDTRHWGSSAVDLSDLYWGLESGMEAVPSGGTVTAGTTLGMTVLVLGLHPKEHDPPLDDVAVEGVEVNFLILDGGGTLAATGATALILDEGGNVVGLTLLTDENGNSTVEWTVVEGTNTLQASSPEANGVITFTITGTAPAPAPTGSVAGTVAVDDQTPLVGASVSVVGTPHRAITNTDGQYLITNVPAGSYTIQAEAFGHTPKSADVDVIGGETANVSFLLDPVDPIDGVLSEGEWDDATTYGPFDVNLPDGGLTTATLFIKNTPTELFVAIRYDQDLSGHNIVTMGLRLDEDGDGDWGLGDGNGEDGFTVQQRVAGSRADTFFDSFFTCAVSPCQGQSDAAHGGTNDGRTASTDGEGPTTIEIAKGINTADVRDAILESGQNLGFFLLTNIGSTSSTLASTRFPAAGTTNYVVR